MAIDESMPGSPGWWFAKLAKKLYRKRGKFELLQSYVDGCPPLPEGVESVRKAYQRFQSRALVNLAKLVVTAAKDRMMPIGFQTGSEGDEVADGVAWDIWQGNHLDADHTILMDTLITLGEAYTIVGDVDEDTGVPLITIESPFQCVTINDPKNMRKVLAGLKIYHDEVFEVDRAAVVILDTESGNCTKYEATRPAGEVKYRWSADSWTWDTSQTQQIEGPVPFVKFTNDPDIYGNGIGEFEPHLSVLDRIHYTILQRMIIIATQAFRQRAIKGMPDTDADGNEIDYDGLFSPDPGSLWLLPEEGEMWESQPGDIGPILTATMDDLKMLSAVTRTPLYYFAPEGANQTAEGASLAREGQISKVQQKLANVAESYEQMMSLAFLRLGDTTRAKSRDMQVLWMPPELFSLTERADAASKAGADIPWRTKMLKLWQFTVTDVERMERERADEQLQMAALVGPQQPAGPAQQGPGGQPEEEPVNGEESAA